MPRSKTPEIAKVNAFFTVFNKAVQA